MNRIALTAAALFCTVAFAAAAHADPGQTGALGAIEAGEGTALERVLSRDETLSERITRAYEADDAQPSGVAAIDRAAFSSAALYRVLQPEPQLVAAR